MTKRALSAAVSLANTLGVAGFLSLCLPLSAQEQAQRPDFFSALNRSVLHAPSLTLPDGQRFLFPSAFSWIEATQPDFLPALSMANTTAKSRRATAAAAPAEDSSKEVVAVRRDNLFDYARGEVGFLYGRSIGKYGAEVEQGYIFGETGNDKFHISVGASYENLSGHVQRFGR